MFISGARPLPLGHGRLFKTILLGFEVDAIPWSSLSPEPADGLPTDQPVPVYYEDGAAAIIAHAGFRLRERMSHAGRGRAQSMPPAPSSDGRGCDGLAAPAREKVQEPEGARGRTRRAVVRPYRRRRRLATFERSEAAGFCPRNPLREPEDSSLRRTAIYGGE